MNELDGELENACILVERICRRLGKDCQVIFTDKGVSIAPVSWSGDSFGKTFYKALQDAMKNEE